MRSERTKNVGIYVFEGAEVLDFAGPFEVFTTATRMHLRGSTHEEPPFQVFLVAEQPGVVAVRGGMRLLVDYHFAEHPPIDVLIIPGGPIERELEREALPAWLLSISRSAEIVAAVCTGAFILARTGLLEGRRATTHWEDAQLFSEMFPGVDLQENERWVDEGRILTSAGIAAGIDMSLHVVSRLMGRALAERTARQMDYHWQETP